PLRQAAAAELGARLFAVDKQVCHRHLLWPLGPKRLDPMAAHRRGAVRVDPHQIHLLGAVSCDVPALSGMSRAHHAPSPSHVITALAALAPQARPQFRAQVLPYPTAVLRASSSFLAQKQQNPVRWPYSLAALAGSAAKAARASPTAWASWPSRLDGSNAPAVVTRPNHMRRPSALRRSWETTVIEPGSRAAGPATEIRSVPAGLAISSAGYFRRLLARSIRATMAVMSPTVRGAAGWAVARWASTAIQWCCFSDRVRLASSDWAKAWSRGDSLARLSRRVMMGSMVGGCPCVSLDTSFVHHLR